MLEGRNERVYILLLAYIIGFTTAYIGFGLTESGSAPAAAPQFQLEPPANVSLTATTNGLEFIKDGERTLLSASSKLLKTPPTEDTPGVHQAVAEYELSGTADYVYFCEVPVIDGTYCRPYLYHVKKDVVTPVKIEGQQLQLDPVPHEVVWGDNGIAMVAGVTIN